ncbi:hypothetical protein E3Q10_03129 [Wallemia mellicola]|uniref:Uncharacterized protein n=1 Tax=Wallemia mellicola TaxID=1708541 RepID=A0A4T0THM5_9BASI|nr:hypothetical protein E3Q24_03084 [Wallemia mellicola]TIB85526.1 hypothetical protein E3Q20_03220 [Wallemia mellicola]TIC10824.1 hypothetical protein E3Q14_02592 [Wallemia mellicola]TIC28534.1 hypothetical protein E3Q10_03129 [Wallemia mellicola]TIC34429.1 hypothetical protein E3Q09_02954 [Wallemia mellicola]
MKTSQIAQLLFAGTASACLVDECSDYQGELVDRCNPEEDFEMSNKDLKNISDEELQFLACYCEVFQSANNECRSCLNQAPSEDAVTHDSICQQVSSSSSSSTSMSSTSTAGSTTTTASPSESEDGDNNDDDNSDSEDDDGDSGANAFSFKCSAMVASGLAVGAAILL